MVCAQTMVQPCVHGTRINHTCQRHLVNAPKPLVKWMRHHLLDDWFVDGNEPIDRVVNDFSHGLAKIWLA